MQDKNIHRLWFVDDKLSVAQDYADFEYMER